MSRNAESSRGRLLLKALQAVVILRRGRWTIKELANELGIEGRAAYRLIASLRSVGITIQVSREREAPRGMATGYYRVPAEPLRKLLKLL